MDSHIKEIIKILDNQRDEFHKEAAARFYLCRNEKDPVFCELCKKANYMAILRRKIYTGEIDI